MKENGGDLVVKLTPIAIRPDDRFILLDLDPGNYLQLTVVDTGHGINAEILPRIFEPYFTTKSIDEGTGMGLATVHVLSESKGEIFDFAASQGWGQRFIYFSR